MVSVIVSPEEIYVHPVLEYNGDLAQLERELVYANALQRGGVMLAPKCLESIFVFKNSTPSSMSEMI